MAFMLCSRTPDESEEEEESEKDERGDTVSEHYLIVRKKSAGGGGCCVLIVEQHNPDVCYSSLWGFSSLRCGREERRGGEKIGKGNGNQS